MIQTIILLVIIAIVAFINTRPKQKKLINFNKPQLIDNKPITYLKKRVIKKGRAHTIRFGF